MPYAVILCRVCIVGGLQYNTIQYKNKFISKFLITLRRVHLMTHTQHKHSKYHAKHHRNNNSKLKLGYFIVIYVAVVTISKQYGTSLDMSQQCWN